MPTSGMRSLVEGLTILVADSNAFMRGLTRCMLIQLGARRIIDASDGVTAVDAIRTLNPDVMFLELNIPVLDGLEVTRIVRSPGVFPRPDLPIVMLTRYGERGNVMRALRVGVHEFLVKPTSANAIHDRLRSILLKPRPWLG